MTGIGAIASASYLNPATASQLPTTQPSTTQGNAAHGVRHHHHHQAGAADPDSDGDAGAATSATGTASPAASLLSSVLDTTA